MGNRSKLAAAAAGSAFALGAFRRMRRRARAVAAGRGFVEDVMPSILEPGSTAPKEALPDEAHAPGHRHLPLTGTLSREAPPPVVRERPFAKHFHGLRHPGRG